MAQDQPKGAIDRKIDEMQARFDQRIKERQAISDRVQQSINESRGGKQ
jgi:hypothetical protein